MTSCEGKIARPSDPSQLKAVTLTKVPAAHRHNFGMALGNREGLQCAPLVLGKALDCHRSDLNFNKNLNEA